MYIENGEDMTSGDDGSDISPNIFSLSVTLSGSILRTRIVIAITTVPQTRS